MLLKIVISLGAIGAIIAHLLYPTLKIDMVTFGLIIVAILPWLSTLIESAKFPGGWEVKFRDVQNAGAKVMSETMSTSVAAAEAFVPPS